MYMRGGGWGCGKIFSPQRRGGTEYFCHRVHRVFSRAQRGKRGRGGFSPQRRGGTEYFCHRVHRVFARTQRGKRGGGEVFNHRGTEGTGGFCHRVHRVFSRTQRGKRGRRGGGAGGRPYGCWGGRAGLLLPQPQNSLLYFRSSRCRVRRLLRGRRAGLRRYPLG